MQRILMSTLFCSLIIGHFNAWAQVPKPTQVVTASNASTSSTVQPAHELTAKDVESFLDGLMPLQLQREDIAGAVVVVVKDGKTLFSRGYGFADTKQRIPVSPSNTLFRPGSISKTFTWTAVMQLVEQGKLNLDRDVNDYVDFQVPHTFGRPVTMRNLMTHTPGFEEVIKDLGADRPDQLTPLGPFVKAHEPKQIYAPGTIPAYSNYGADLAGYIVERVSGVPFEDYVQKNIFHPLGISDATFVQPLPPELNSRVSNGYDLGSGEAKPFELVPPQIAPDGGLSITGDDMARYMIAHLQNGKYGDGRILEAPTAEMMHARQFSMDPAVNGMALGFYEENQNGHRIVGHGGDLNYFHSDMHLVLDQGLGFFVSYNSAGKGESDVRTALWQAFLNRYLPPPDHGTEPANTKAADSVTGMYLSSRRAQTTILRPLWFVLAEAAVTQGEDGTIEVDNMKNLAGQPKRWRGIGNMQFREVGGHQLLVFKPDASGRMQMITDDPIEILQKVPWTENKTFLTFALGFAVLVFALTLLLWPAGALVRRHYRQELSLTAQERKLRLLVKFACILDLISLVLFAAVLAYGFSKLSVFSEGFDPVFRLLQLLFLLGIIGSIAMLYSGFRLWRAGRSRFWPGIYTAGLTAASVIYIWFVLSSRVVQASLKY